MDRPPEVLIPALHLLIAATVAAGAPSRTPAGPADSLRPPRRAHHAMGYDEVGRRVLLTGGSTPLDGGRRFEFFDDLWAFDGRRWTPLPSSGAKMSGSRLAFDRRQGRMVSFGGYDGRASLGVVRALVGDRWEELGTDPEVAAAEAGFVFDAGRGRFLAFGGAAGQGRSGGDTWEFDGRGWTRVAGSSPPARQAHAMAYDEARGRTVLFGGMGQGPPGRPGPTLGDTWEFDGRTWTERRVAGPSPRHGAGITYDSKRRLVILFGGDAEDGFKGDTWGWDGSGWRKLADAGPSPRAMGYLAYDAARDRVVLFGGRQGYPDGDLADTWEWDGAAWREVALSPAAAPPPD